MGRDGGPPPAPSRSPRRPVKLCIVSPFGERRGGSDEVLLALLRHLDRERVDPRAVLLEQGDLAKDVGDLGVPVRTTDGGRMRNPVHLAATAYRLAGVLRHERPDLLLNWLSTAHIYGAPAAAMSGLSKRTVWWQHDLPTVEGWGRRRALDQLAAALPARAILANSQAVAEAQRRLWPRRQVVAIPPGIEAPREPAAAEIAKLREELGWQDDGVPVVGLVGRLVRWKGAHRLLEALAQLRADGVVVRGLIVGGTGHDADAAYEAEVRAIAARLGIGEHVAFTGWVADPAPYVKLMDVLVNASQAEPFGLTLLEGMALGVPVVAVASGGPEEIIDDRVSGMLVASARPRELATAIRELLSDAALRRRLAEAGCSRYRERYTAERMTREFEAALRALLP